METMSYGMHNLILQRNKDITEGFITVGNIWNSSGNVEVHYKNCRLGKLVCLCIRLKTGQGFRTGW